MQHKNLVLSLLIFRQCTPAPAPASNCQTSQACRRSLRRCAVPPLYVAAALLLLLLLLRGRLRRPRLLRPWLGHQLLHLRPAGRRRRRLRVPPVSAAAVPLPASGCRPRLGGVRVGAGDHLGRDGVGGKALEGGGADSRAGGNLQKKMNAFCHIRVYIEMGMPGNKIYQKYV